MNQSNRPYKLALAAAQNLTSPEDWQAYATVWGLLAGYDFRWKSHHAEIELLQVEQSLESPLTNVKTGRSSRTFTLGGKIDKLARVNGELCLIDHKTTSMDISDPTSAYWRQLAVDSQSSHYELLLLSNGVRVDRVIWDVVRKPGIRPKNIPAKWLKELLSTGVYCGFDVKQESLAAVEETQRENAELFAYRLAAECIAEPGKYYARRDNPRTSDQLAEYAEELWEVANSIRQAEINETHFRNSGACFNFGAACEYLPLCSGCDTVHSGFWTRKDTVHPELDEVVGENILSHSRMRCFQTCRRKHFYRYELGVERADAERREALFFGSLWHETLDVYWRSHSQEKDDGSNKQSVGCTDSSAAELVGGN